MGGGLYLNEVFVDFFPMPGSNLSHENAFSS